MPIAPRLAIALACLLTANLAAAKIPPPSEEAQAKAAEAAVKSAWAGKVAAYQLCQVQDRIVSSYRAKRLITDKDLKEPVATPPCTDPGPFAGAANLEKAGAHSSPGQTPAAPAPAPASAPEASASAPKS